jgi:hypothetical protein
MDPIEASAVVPRLRFRLENEVKLNYSARITGVEWDRHAEAVKYMHEQRRTRREILETLNTEYEFCPSMAQLNAYMRKRKLRVYGSGNAEPVETAEDEVLQVADVVAGADDSSASTSLPAGQNNGASELQKMENLERDLTTRDAVPLALPGDDQDREPRFPKWLAQASVTTPTDCLPDLSPLNLDSIIPDDFETSKNTTSLMHDTVARQSSRERELDTEEPAGNIPESSSDRNIAKSEAVRDTEKAVAQLDPTNYVDSDQYAASRAPSTFSPISHRSGGSSLKAFRHFAVEVARGKQLQHKDSPESVHALTIMSDDSWDFNLVTGIRSEYHSPSSRQPLTDADLEVYWSRARDYWLKIGPSLMNRVSELRDESNQVRES